MFMLCQVLAMPIDGGGEICPLAPLSATISACSRIFVKAQTLLIAEH